MQSIFIAFTTMILTSDYTPSPTVWEVEVAPKKFATVTRWDWTADDPRNVDTREKTRLKIELDGHVADWEGREIPIVLRAQGETLFLIGFDREKCRELNDFRYRFFNYYRSHDGKFESIPAQDFPKKLATQNMWLTDKETEVAVRNLDTSSMSFRLSPNAAIWLQLMSGDRVQGSVTKETLDQFIRDFRPEPLTILHRKAQISGNNRSKLNGDSSAGGKTPMAGSER